jgi:CheY-like chemotaxis protein
MPSSATPRWKSLWIAGKTYKGTHPRSSRTSAHGGLRWFAGRYRRKESATKILLIDDDEAVLGVVALMLTVEGHAVMVASSGRDGLARLEAGESVDLVLTDLNMPDMDGWAVMRAVRSRWPSVRVGIQSGSLEKVSDEHELPDLLLAKPVSLEDLRKAIGWLR